MELNELLKFIDKQDKKLMNSYDSANDVEKRVLARAVKLSEETGELCSESLAFNKQQRQTKLKKHSKESLENEVADVLISTLLLAKTMDVDIKKALKNKIKKIDERFKDISI